MLHMKLLNSKKTRIPRFDKTLVIRPIAEMYGASNERQLCSEIAYLCDDAPGTSLMLHEVNALYSLTPKHG